MKRTSFWLLLATLLTSVGCLKEDAAEKESANHILNATIEEFYPESRVGFDLGNDASFFWTNGDAIAVGTGSPFYRYTTDVETGASTASFTGTGERIGYAAYPYERVLAISANELTYEFANEYEYNNVDSDFFSGMSVDLPMWAEIESTEAMFRHLGGIIAFKFPALEEGNDMTLTVTAEQKISGRFTVDLRSSDTPEFTTTETDNEEEKKVTIKFSLSETQDAVFYVPVPVGTYNLITVLKKDENEYSVEVRGLTVKRRGIRFTTISKYSLEGGTENQN